MNSPRSPVRAQAVALFATIFLALNVPHVAAESPKGELAARAPSPYDRQYSSFAAEDDLACCPAGSTKKDAGTCCGAGLVCDSRNSTGYGPMCITVPATTNGTNGTNTNHTGNHTTGGPSPTETDSGAVTVAAWGMFTSVAGLAAVVGLMSF